MRQPRTQPMTVTPATRSIHRWIGAYIEGDGGSDGCSTFASCRVASPRTQVSRTVFIAESVPRHRADRFPLLQLAPVACPRPGSAGREHDRRVHQLWRIGGAFAHSVCVRRRCRIARRPATTSRRWRASSRRTCMRFGISAFVAALGAPAHLVRAARRAAPDRGAARAAARLARRFGGVPVRPRVRRARQPTSSRCSKTARRKGASERRSGPSSRRGRPITLAIRRSRAR